MHQTVRLAITMTMLAGCTPRARQSGATPAESATRVAASKWVSAFATRDVDAIAASFADDAVALYPRSGPIRGREANRRLLAAFFSLPNASHPITTDTVMASRSGDMSVTRGRYLLRYDSAAHPVTLGGQYVAVWRADTIGTWHIVNLIANMYAPPPQIDTTR